MAEAPWLTIIGIGEDGLAGLSDASRKALGEAEIVFGGPRHLALAEIDEARARNWPVPFCVEPVIALRSKRVAVLASGDPFWYGAGTPLAEKLRPGEWVCFPAPSTFSLAAARLGWRLEETICLGLHAAPFERLRPGLARGTQAIVLLRDGAAAHALAAWLTEQGFGASKLFVLEALGGARERLREATAQAYQLNDVAHPVAVAIMCEGASGLPRAAGLPDGLFQHDGQITKAPVRAITLAALGPRPGERLWDIGAGSGSVSIEWMLAAPGCTACAVERRADRAACVLANAQEFGVGHRLELIEASAPQGMDSMAAPDAVFIGGGASQELLTAIWQRISPGTRLVANAVTLESEALLAAWHGRHSGRLLRIDIAEAGPLGSKRGWNAARPIVQWSVVR